VRSKCCAEQHFPAAGSKRLADRQRELGVEAGDADAVALVAAEQPDAPVLGADEEADVALLRRASLQLRAGGCAGLNAARPTCC